MAIRTEKFADVLRELIEEITGKREDVRFDDGISGVVYGCITKNNVIIQSNVEYYLVGRDNSKEQGIRKSLRSKFLPLLEQSFDLFVMLHEIGHTITCVGLNYKTIRTERAMFIQYAQFNLKPGTVARRYRQTTQERKADEFAYDWMIGNPERVKYYAEKFERALK